MKSQATHKPKGKYNRIITVLLVVLSVLIGLIICLLGYFMGSGKSAQDVLDILKAKEQSMIEELETTGLTEQQLREVELQLQVRDRLHSIMDKDVDKKLVFKTKDKAHAEAERIGLPDDSKYIIQLGSGQPIFYVENLDQNDWVSLDLNLKTAKYVGDGYIKDSRFVYHDGKLIVGADPETCTVDTIGKCDDANEWKEKFSAYAFDVRWNDAPVEAKDILPSLDWSCSEGKEVGVVTDGTLAGGKVLIQTKDESGMWCSNSTPPNEINHYVYFNDFLIPINQDTGFSFKDERVRVGEGFLWGSDWWDKGNQGHIINITNTGYWLERGTSIGLVSVRDNYSVSNENDSSLPDYQISSTSPPLMEDPLAGPIYRSYGDCFVSKRPDHVTISYRLGFDYIDPSTGLLDLTLLGGSKNTEAYNYIPSYHSCYSLVKEEWLKPNERLVIVGEFPNGDEVYKLSNPQDEHLVAKYEDKNTLASFNGGENKYSYDEYLSFNPYLYWRDPFGGWVQFMNKRFETAAEKCKPVVYLYPEETGDFSVFVEPNAGFTKTIPDYGSGWHVTATPDSQITDKATGDTYPYLYWAGINTDIPQITEGWVVPKEEAEIFLVEKLTQLGLNEQEIEDFNEYWIDRFDTEGADQYKIMFLPQHLFELLAPLTVEGDDTPDTIIRVMMYAQPAMEGETLPKQILPPKPGRQGFTVTEWGGAMFN